MSVDLRTCKAGDRLRLRDGSDAEYLMADSMHTEIGYPHLIRKCSDMRTDTAADNGMLFEGRATYGDVVEIVGQA